MNYHSLTNIELMQMVMERALHLTPDTLSRKTMIEALRDYDRRNTELDVTLREYAQDLRKIQDCKTKFAVMLEWSHFINVWEKSLPNTVEVARAIRHNRTIYDAYNKALAVHNHPTSGLRAFQNTATDTLKMILMCADVL